MKVLHSGDLGDIIYAMPIFRAIGPCEVWLDDRPWTKKLLGPRAEAMVRLLLSQPYVGEVRFGTPSGEYLDVSTFRSGGIPFGENLTSVQAKWARVPVSTSPWIDVAKSPLSLGRVVVHRSPRYQNPWFRWADIAEYYGDRILAVGSKEEVNELSAVCGRSLEHARTCDFLDLARVIHGADLFIGNQSSPCAVAVGLGGRFIQETCLWVPDCLFPERKESVFCFDGYVPGITDPWEPTLEIDEAVTPPGGWTWPGGSRMGLHSAVKASGLPKAEIISHTIERVPNFFATSSWESLFSPVKEKLVEISARSG